MDGWLAGWLAGWQHARGARLFTGPGSGRALRIGARAVRKGCLARQNLRARWSALIS